jgi:hypothetical protein
MAFNIGFLPAIGISIIALGIFAAIKKFNQMNV